MKILRLIRSVHRRGGGPIEGIRQVSQELARRGHTVELASLDPVGAPWLSGLEMKHFALGVSEHGYGFSRAYVPWLQARAAEYDAVIVSGLWQYTSFGAWRALRGSATPYYVFPHGMLDAWFKRRYPLKHLKKWLYWPWADYRVLRDARAVLFTSEEERRSSRDSFPLYRCRERVVNYGTAAPEGAADGQRALFLAQFPALRHARILLFLGRLHEKKGCELLLRAFASLARGASGKVRLVIAGPCADPAYLTSLRALAAELCPPESVQFTGMLSGQVKWGAFRAAEAFVLPSHQENFGLAVAEALACGTPVFLSDKVNIWREIVEDGTGVVESDTLAGTTKLLERALSLSPEQRAQMSVAARRCFEQRFEIGTAATALLEALGENQPSSPAPPRRFAPHENPPELVQFSPDVGGLETASAILATEFVAQGHEVRLATQTAEDDGQAWPFHVLRRPRLGALLQHVRWCDVYFQNNISLQGVWAALWRRRPWVVAHQTWLRDIHGRQSWREWLKRRLLRFAANIVISQAIGDDVGVPSTPIGNPYRAEIFRLLPEIAREQDLIFVGRLVSDKGLDLLVEALALLRREGLTPRLTVVGTGPEEEAIRRQAQAAGVLAQIDFAGLRTGAALAALLNAHRIMVVPSRWAEPFGIVALEGIACGCAVVGSAEGGLGEAIGPCGLTFPNGEAAALTAQLALLLRDPRLAESLLVGRAAHLARFEPATVARQYLEVFAQSIE